MSLKRDSILLRLQAIKRGTSKVLADATNVDVRQVTKHLQILEAEGVIRRDDFEIGDDHCRRIVYVALTDAEIEEIERRKNRQKSTAIPEWWPKRDAELEAVMRSICGVRV